MSGLGYEVGDEVYTFKYSYGYTRVGGPYTVTKITPTGRYTLNNGSQFMPDGRRVGDGGAWSSTRMEHKDNQLDTRSLVAAAQAKRDLKSHVFNVVRNLVVMVESAEDRDDLAATLEALAKDVRSFVDTSE